MDEPRASSELQDALPRGHTPCVGGERRAVIKFCAPRRRSRHTGFRLATFEPTAMNWAGSGYAANPNPLSSMDERELIHDWNEDGERWDKPAFRIQLDDETLRDGLQSPSVRTPAIEDKLAILHLMDRLGIDTADIGLPGAGPHVVRAVTRLAQEIADHTLRIQANCAARTLKQDITPVVEISQKTGIP